MADKGLPAVIADLVPAFLARRRDDVASMRAALSAGNLEPVRLAGHRLAGSAAGYGFPEMGRLGRELELAALRHDVRAAARALEALAGILDDLSTAVPESNPLRVVVLEDDPDQLALVRRWLEAAGHRCLGFGRSEDLMKSIGGESVDVFVLDWMLPDISGEIVLQWIRQALPGRVPVMFATARDEESEIVEILRLGADDYLAKPLRHGEFVARVEALARRASAAGGDCAPAAGPYRFDLATRAVSIGDRHVALPPRLAEIAHVLFERPGVLVSRGFLYERAWGRPLEGATRTVDTHVSRLRKLLELDGRHGWRLVSVYQHGYRLEQQAHNP